MKINAIQTKNIRKGSEVDDYLEKRLKSVEKLIDKEDESISLDVQLEKESKHKRGEIYRTEFNLSIAGKILRVEETAEDLLASIDRAKDELMRRLRKNKTKKLAQRRKRV